MYLKLVIFILLLYKFKVYTKEDEEIYYTREVKKSPSELSPFENMKNTVTTFFSTSVAKFEKKRKQIKKALYRFFYDVFYNIPPCSLRFTINEDTESESDMSASDLIILHGYRVETHTVLTPDGYMLSVHRILQKPPNTISDERRIAILNHGLMGSSLDWILLGPKKALPYLLTDAGYDVWLPNFRGNKYSRTHMTKLTDTADFWKFSWHEIGLFDIPAVIGYVRETTGKSSQINIITYCMSSSALLVLLSTSQHYNAILKSATLLAPLVYMDHISGPLQNLAELYMQHKILHNSSILNEREFKLEELFYKPNIVRLCKENESLCKNPLLLLDSGKSNLTLRTKYNSVPSGGSTQTIIHYLQLINSGQFQMFDWGKMNNYAKYGNASPPRYELWKVNVPLLLFNSISDSISTVTDLTKLKFHIPVIRNYVIKDDNLTHFDFLWAEKATKLVYLPLIKELQNF